MKKMNGEKAIMTNEKNSNMIKNMNFVKVLAKLVIIIAVLLSFVNFNSTVNAGDTASDLINAGNRFIETGEAGARQEGFGVDDFVNDFVGIGQILVGIGVALLVGIVLVMAIKWITAKPDQMATLKQQTIGIVVAAVVIFGAVGIWNLVRAIMDSVQSSMGG